MSRKMWYNVAEACTAATSARRSDEPLTPTSNTLCNISATSVTELGRKLAVRIAWGHVTYRMQCYGDGWPSDGDGDDDGDNDDSKHDDEDNDDKSTMMKATLFKSGAN
jgi:hypothetical protein